MKMQLYTVKNDNDLDITFLGELLAHVSTKKDGAPRWTELKLYQAALDKMYIVEKKGLSNVKGEVVFCASRICKTKDELIKTVGTNRIAKKLYKEAGISVSNKIE